MRRLALAFLLSGVAILPLGCGSSGSSNPDGKAGAGGAGHDGGAGTGGAGTGGAGAGGSTAGSDGGAGTGDAAAGTDGGAAGSDASTTDAGDATGDATDGPVLTATQLRGQYLVNSVLGCSGCHTPQKVGGGGADLTKFLAGNDCFAKDTGGGCLASANLTNDATGLKDLSDQQIIDAMTKGIDPDKVDGGTVYLFANMPYYQFSNLTAGDASAIVAYLRTVTAVAHAAPANTGTFATRPTSPQWAPITLADLPSPAAADGGTDGGSDAGTVDGGAASTSNGKYMAALMCSTCHTVNTSATAPLQLDATKAFQGGKEFTTTVTVPVDGGTDGGADGGADAGDAATTMTVSKKIQSMNLTPDTTGLKTWTAAQIVTAIKMGKDEAGRTICTPMRPFPNLTDSDAMDIANYLQAIPAATNAITLTCE